MVALFQQVCKAVVGMIPILVGGMGRTGTTVQGRAIYCHSGAFSRHRELSVATTPAGSESSSRHAASAS